MVDEPYKFDIFSQNPGRSPGSAKIDSPCGVYGGNPNGCHGGIGYLAGGASPFNLCKGGGLEYGPDAIDQQFGQIQVTNWSKGQEVEVGWSITANYGGWYSYRLCKLGDNESRAELTEECFQETVLPFVGETQWIKKNANGTDKIPIKAVRTSVGTTPAGSVWTRDPVMCTLTSSIDSVGHPHCQMFLLYFQSERKEREKERERERWMDGGEREILVGMVLHFSLILWIDPFFQLYLYPRFKPST